MTAPGPIEMGRGIVVPLGTPVPAQWRDSPVVRISTSELEGSDARSALIDRLHRAWVARQATVIVWDGPPDLLEVTEAIDVPPWSLDAGYLFPYERLRFLVFSNNYDARTGSPQWWWAVKAQRIEAVPGGPADAMLPDGTPVWIDGGPRQALPAYSHPVVHGESVDARHRTMVPPAVDAPAADLADDQREAVGHRAGAARIIAPAGSGKTRTLTARLRHILDDGAIEPELVTALAYNERAAAQVRERLGVGRGLARTIHSLGWEILREAHSGLELVDDRGVRDTIEQLISIPRRPNADPVAPYLEALSAVRSRLRNPAEVEMSRDDVAGFAPTFDGYRKRLYAMGRVDHDEQVYGAIEALLRSPQLRSRWQRRCRHLLVDEFQDLTPAYLLLLRLVASPELSVFGVGDDDQVIYGYDGADPGFLIDFDRFFPGSDSHALITNYRCPPAVVDAARHLLSYNKRRIDKTIQAARTDQSTEALDIRTLPGGGLAVACAEVVGGWLDDGVGPGDIAVLARVNSSLIAVKAALVEVNIPSNDLLGASSLDRTALRALFAWMRLALDPELLRRADILEAIRRPGRGLTRLAREVVGNRVSSIDDLGEIGSRLGSKQAERWAGFCDDLARVAAAARKGSSGDVVGALVEDVGLGSSARALDSGRGNASRSGHLDDLVAVRRAAALHPSADDFERWLRTAIARQTDEGGVTLSSVHRVKGMEWKRVIVFGCDAGAMPHELADDVEEERRILHVALTRAIDSVVVMADAARPSGFLRELDGSAARTESSLLRSTTPSRRSGRIPVPGDHVRLWGGHHGVVQDVVGEEIVVDIDAGARMTARRADIVELTPAPGREEAEASPALVAALKTWRAETARRLAVPAYVVLHDKTIEEIARRLPRSESELLAVTGVGPAKLDQHGDDILGLVDQLA